MEISLATKALLGLLGVGAAGGTVVVGYKIFKGGKEVSALKIKKSVAQLISEEGKKVLLTSSDDANGADWKASWKLYRDNNKTSTASKDPWTLTEFKGNYSSSIPDEQAPNTFIGRCDTESKKEVFDTTDLIYINVYRWCTKDKATGPQPVAAAA